MSLEEELSDLTIAVDKLRQAVDAQAAAQPNADRRYILKAMAGPTAGQHYLVDGNRIRNLTDPEGLFWTGNGGPLSLYEVTDDGQCLALWKEAAALQGYVAQRGEAP
jgi:hypothetical protein